MGERRGKSSIGKMIDYILRPPLSYVMKPGHIQTGVDPRIIVLSDPKSHICEQYRRIITNLDFNASDKKIKSIVITSTAREEGKSCTSANIAALLSTYANKKVLLVDGDLRKPNMHKLFNLPRTPGLTDIFFEHLDPEKVIHSVMIERTTPYVLTAGSSITSCADLLSSNEFKGLISKLESKFDYVIFDSPPMLAVADPAVLAKTVGGVILVVKANETPESALAQTLSLLEDVKAHIVGFVLTHTRPEMHPYYYYSKYYKYYRPYGYYADSLKEKGDG